MVKHLKTANKAHILYAASIFLIISTFNLVFLSTSTSALSYQSTINNQFTFNPTISVNLSGDLTIDELVPGSYADSNIITVGVDTNVLYGYTLTATVGTKAGNTNSLINTADSSNIFRSIATNATVATLAEFTDNYWGYSYSTDSGANWVSGTQGSTSAGYSGLPLDANDSISERGNGGVTLLDNDGEAGESNSVQFKIGAKASAAQASGEYTNTINFYTVSKPEPPFCDTHTCMQDLNPSNIASLLPSVGSTATVYDSRDEQAYTIAKLKDNKYWMVENLNLAGGTTLSSADTDMPDGYTLPTANNFQSGNKLPASATAGFNDNTKAFVYNSGNKTNCGASGQNTPCYSYYSWTAATLGSGLSISTDNTDAPYSICPKGWKLPTSRTTSASNWQTTSDFYALAHQYGLDSTTSTSESDDGFYTQAGPGTTPNFLLTGRYSDGSFGNGGSYGGYWSATSRSGSGDARNFSFNSSRVNSADYRSRDYGFSVRCLLK